MSVDEVGVLEQPAGPSVEDIIKGLTGFGIEDNEELLTIKASGKEIKLRLSNLPTQDEMMALLAVEDAKGYLWIQKIKVEILSRSISHIDGINIRLLNPKQRLVKDPTSTIAVVRDIQAVLRNILFTWGQEVIGILWKVLMVHSQKIEDRLLESFPESAVMTQVEKRFFEQAVKEIDDVNRAAIADQINDLFAEDGAEQVAKVEEDLNKG